MSERIEPGAEAAHRDDLARDVAAIWADRCRREPHWVDDPLCAALDQLVDVYGLKP